MRSYAHCRALIGSLCPLLCGLTQITNRAKLADSLQAASHLRVDQGCLAEQAPEPAAYRQRLQQDMHGELGVHPTARHCRAVLLCTDPATWLLFNKKGPLFVQSCIWGQRYKRSKRLKCYQN